MASLDDQIDQLFQLPVADFTAARNALAKTAGQAGAAIKRLEKPAMAAWVVNQLYWRHRADYDRLIAASEALRAVQRRQLAGKSADVPAAEAAHDDARRALMDRARDVLRLAGEAASPATMTGVSETLMALPADERPGRLTRSLKPLGFQALLGMMAGTPLSSPPASSRGSATSSTARPAGTSARPPEEDKAARAQIEKAAKRAEADRERERVARVALIHSELKKVTADEREAMAAAASATRSLAAARTEQARLESQLTEVAERVRQLAETSGSDERRAAALTKSRLALEERLGELKEP